MQSLYRPYEFQIKLIGVFSLCLLITGIAFQGTISGLFSIWLIFDETYGHGFLVAITSLFLVCRALLQSRDISSPPGWHYFLPLLIASLLVSLAEIVGVELIRFALIPVIILLSFTVIVGVGVSKRIIVPVLLLYFAVPFWDHINGALVELTSFVVQNLVARSGITAFITGNSIYIPSGELVIASGCSGLRYFIIGTFLGVLSSYLDGYTLKRQVLLIVIVALISLLANWVRVYGITIIAYESEMQSPLVKDHEILGWILFMLFIFPVLYLNGRYLNNVGVIAHEQATVPSDINQSSQQKSGRMISTLAAFILVILSVSIAPYIIYRFEHAGSNALEVNDISSPFITDWAETAYIPEAAVWQPQLNAPDKATVVKYTKGLDAVIVYQFLYVKNGLHDEILPYVENMHGRDTWVVINTGFLDKFKLIELTNKHTQESVLVAYQFNVGGFTTSSYLLAKLYQFPAVARQQPYALFTAATVSCVESCENAGVLLASFIEGR